MATITLRQMRCVRRHKGAGAGGAEETGGYGEAASQSYGAGGLVYRDSGGDIAVATATSLILGQARKAATGTTAQNAEVDIIHPEDEFVMNCTNDGTASATVDTDLGKCFGIKIVSGNVYLDQAILEDATNGDIVRVKAIQLWPEDALGDTGGRYVVRFLEFVGPTDGSTGFAHILQGVGG